MKKCKVCGKNCDSDYCFQHKPRKKIPSKSFGKGIYQQMREGPIMENFNKDLDKAVSKASYTIFMMNIWTCRTHKSEVSGTYLGKSFSSAYIHHILPKNKYPQAKLDPENVILLTMDEHNNVENDMYRYEEINKKREILIRKYNL